MTKRQNLNRIRRRIKPTPPDHAPQIARINEITSTSKTIWFGLLSYLAFVAVTWMGVQDPDFFLPQAQTDLPLIGVSVPTLLFFSLAPAIGALIYAYFHMQLLKLWEALTDAPPEINETPLSDHIAPWLVSDLCLSYRPAALRRRPLARSSHWINFLIVYWGTPTVLAALWLRSAPPHYDWLTLGACGLPLIFSLYVGLSSWHRLRQLTRAAPAPAPGLRLWQWALFTLAALAITTLGWLRVEGTFRDYARAFGYDPAGTALDWEITDFLVPAQLAGVNFAQVPDDWRDRETFRREYRPIWCARAGLPPNVCSTAPDLESQDPLPESLRNVRLKYCGREDIAPGSSQKCVAFFTEAERQFEADWLRQRALDLAKLYSFDLSGKDLRGANLIGAQLQGAELRGAQLQSADLEGAQLQGAILRGAQLQRASLWDTQLQGAELGGAQLQGAYLIGAQLQGAYLWEAQLQGAFLWEAQLQGADLEGAQLQGASLLWAQFDAATSLTAAALRGAAVIGVDFTSLPPIANHLDDLFGDASVKLPDGIARPDHWPDEELERPEFPKAWRDWQRSIGQDPDALE